MKNLFPTGKFVWFILLICQQFFLTVPANAQQSKNDREAELSDQAVKAYGSGSYDVAMNLFNELLQVRTEKYGPNSIKVANILNNVGAIESQLGLYDNATAYYERALPIYEAAGNKELRRLASVHQNLAICFSSMGDIEKAISYYEKAERTFQKLELADKELYEILLMNMSGFYKENNNLPEAERFNKKSFEINPNSKHAFKKWSAKGMICAARKDYPGSIANLYKAIEIGEKDLGTSFAQKGFIYFNLGIVYLEMGDFDRSLPNYLIAKELIQKRIGAKGDVFSQCLTNIGLVYLQKKENESNLEDFITQRKKNIDLSLDYFQKAIIAITPGFNSNDRYANPLPENSIDKIRLLDALKNKAEALYLLAQLEDKRNPDACLKQMETSLSTFDLAIKTIHLIRNSFQNQASKLYLSENEHPVYAEALAVAVHLYEKTNNKSNFEKAFEFSERSRSANFQSILRELQAKEFSGLPDSLIRKETELKGEISAYEDFIFKEKGSSAPEEKKINLWKDRVFTLTKNYQEMMKLVEQEFPRYYQYKYADPIVSVETVQQSLGGREAFIEYFIKENKNNGPNELYTFVLTNHESKIIRKSVNIAFNDTVDQFLKFIKNGMVLNTRKADYIKFTKNASDLYKQLIEPVTTNLQNYRLVIVPDDKLSYIPFDALLSSEADTTRMNFSSLDYLVHHHAISYTYSATLLYYYFQNNLRFSNKIAAFAPDYNSKPDFLPLPGAEIEVAGITRIISGDKYSGSKATKQSFIANAGKYDILHLAMHTILNDTLPLYSKMVFSPGVSGTEDRTLNTYEIYNLKLRSGMVVLSGCNTGSGKLQKGEGVMSLARAFLYAGCPSIIMTLWNVEDASSSSMMIDFYRNIKNGYSKDEALRRAKVSYISQADPMKSHPYFWLGYVSIGKQTPLFKSKAGYFAGLIIFVFLAIVLEKWYFKRKKRISRLE
ncbi:MAG TPA: CHAT domain-containing protein [Prolixibacteraceae bacterium]